MRIGSSLSTKKSIKLKSVGTDIVPLLQQYVLISVKTFIMVTKLYRRAAIKSNKLSSTLITITWIMESAISCTSCARTCRRLQRHLINTVPSPPAYVSQRCQVLPLRLTSSMRNAKAVTTFVFCICDKEYGFIWMCWNTYSWRICKNCYTLNKCLQNMLLELLRTSSDFQRGNNHVIHVRPLAIISLAGHSVCFTSKCKVTNIQWVITIDLFYSIHECVLLAKGYQCRYKTVPLSLTSLYAAFLILTFL